MSCSLASWAAACRASGGADKTGGRWSNPRVRSVRATVEGDVLGITTDGFGDLLGCLARPPHAENDHLAVVLVDPQGREQRTDPVHALAHRAIRVARRL